MVENLRCGASIMDISCPYLIHWLNRLKILRERVFVYRLYRYMEDIYLDALLILCVICFHCITFGLLCFFLDVFYNRC